MAHRSPARWLAALAACASAGCTLHRALSSFADSPDARARVTVQLDDGRRLRGRLMGVGADRAMVVGAPTEGAAPTRAAFDIGQIVAVHRVRPGGLGAPGGLFGALAGGLTGGVVAYARYTPSCTDDDRVSQKGLFELPPPEPPPPCREAGPTSATVGGAALGAVGGLLVGWVVGSNLEMRVVYTPDGRPPPDGPTVAFDPTPDGGRLGLSWRW